jgi:hypothetical protein
MRKADEAYAGLVAEELRRKGSVLWADLFKAGTERFPAEWGKAFVDESDFAGWVNGNGQLVESMIAPMAKISDQGSFLSVIEHAPRELARMAKEKIEAEPGRFMQDLIRLGAAIGGADGGGSGEPESPLLKSVRASRSRVLGNPFVAPLERPRQPMTTGPARYLSKARPGRGLSDEEVAALKAARAVLRATSDPLDAAIGGSSKEEARRIIYEMTGNCLDEDGYRIPDERCQEMGWIVAHASSNNPGRLQKALTGALQPNARVKVIRDTLGADAAKEFPGPMSPPLTMSVRIPAGARGVVGSRFSSTITEAGQVYSIRFREPGVTGIYWVPGKDLDFADSSTGKADDPNDVYHAAEGQIANAVALYENLTSPQPADRTKAALRVAHVLHIVLRAADERAVDALIRGRGLTATFGITRNGGAIMLDGKPVAPSAEGIGKAKYPWDKCIQDQLDAGYSQKSADQPSSMEQIARDVLSQWEGEGILPIGDLFQFGIDSGTELQDGDLAAFRTALYSVVSCGGYTLNPDDDTIAIHPMKPEDVQPPQVDKRFGLGGTKVIHAMGTDKALTVQMGKIPSSDPLAFAHGFTQGWAGSKESTPLKGGGAAYRQGYKLGAEVRVGQKSMPEWASSVSGTTKAITQVDQVNQGGGVTPPNALQPPQAPQAAQGAGQTYQGAQDAQAGQQGGQSGDQPPDQGQPPTGEGFPLTVPIGSMLVLQGGGDTQSGQPDAQGQVLVAFLGEGPNQKLMGIVQQVVGMGDLTPGDRIEFDSTDVVEYIAQELDARDVLESNVGSPALENHADILASLDRGCYPFAEGDCIPVTQETNDVIRSLLAGGGAQDGVAQGGGNAPAAPAVPNAAAAQPQAGVQQQ